MKTLSSLVYLVLALCLTVPVTAGAQANLQDSFALVDFYNKTNGSSWTKSDNWLKGPVETWFGITMGANRSRVASIKLVANNLTGQIPSSISNLTNLRYLNLTKNLLTGIIPPELGNLSGLQYLYLSKLTGNIPPELGNLSALLVLSLRNCEFSGNIPAELGNLSKLQYLDLEHDNLSGNIPLTLAGLNELISLNLGKNKLSGQIPPELGSLPKLDSLCLDNNQLSGNIPRELGSIINLYLNNNQLSGAIPRFSPKNSVILDLSNNKLAGKIPPSLGNFENLSDLRLDHNALNGKIPEEIGNLKNLQYLLLDHNQLKDNVPSSLASLTQLVSLNLTYNSFTFSSMEFIEKTFPFAIYNNQANIRVRSRRDILFVSAGGSLSNNTFKWRKVGDPGKPATIVGDSVFHPAESGEYYVAVTNAVATGLRLFSDTVTYTTPVAPDAITVKGLPTILNNSFSVYPNPAKDILHIQTKGNASFSLLNQTGEIMRTENISNTGSINISGIAPGVYYLKNNNTKAVEKIFIVK